MTRWRNAIASRSDELRASVISPYEPPSRYSNRKCGSRRRANAR
jgi:hypothetical protein